MKFVIFTIFVMIAIAMVTSEEECIVWKNTGCERNADCCRGLRCSNDKAECVPIRGISLPGMDKRPLGPGPYPPNVRMQ